MSCKSMPTVMRHIGQESPLLRLALVVYAIKANDALQEDVQLRMLGGISCSLEERLKDVFRVANFS